MKTRRTTSAFTLLEILAVVSITVVLGALLVPAIGSVRDRATETQCISRLRSLGAAIQSFAADHDTFLPTNTKHNPFDSTDTDTSTATTRGRMYNLVGPYLAPGKVGGDPDYQNEKTFRCPTHDKKDLATVSRNLFKFNDLITRDDGKGVIRDTIAVPVRQGLITRPNETPLAWDVSGSTQTGSNTFMADPSATKYGYTGPTSPLGLSPNHGPRCNILFVSGRVAAADLSSFDNFPWNGKVPAKSPLNTVFDPRYAGN